jgi:hypothetical protein
MEVAFLKKTNALCYIEVTFQSNFAHPLLSTPSICFKLEFMGSDSTVPATVHILENMTLWVHPVPVSANDILEKKK